MRAKAEVDEESAVGEEPAVNQDLDAFRAEKVHPGDFLRQVQPRVLTKPAGKKFRNSKVIRWRSGLSYYEYEKLVRLINLLTKESNHRSTEPTTNKTGTPEATTWRSAISLMGRRKSTDEGTSSTW